MRPPRPTFLRFVATCLELGSTGFGGGLAVLSLVHARFCVRHAWMTEREFFHMSSVAQVLPGGSAANVLTLIGNRFYGRGGGLAGLVAFVAPGSLLTFLLAQVYGRASMHPGVVAFLSGLNAAVVGLIAAMVVRLIPEALRRGWQWVTAAAAAFATAALHFSAVEVLAVAALVGTMIDLGQKNLRARAMRAGRPRPPPSREEPPHVAQGMLLLGIPLAVSTIAELAGTFLKLGIASYGGGFAIIASLHQVAVVQNAWLDERAFADAVAVGQLAPGPVLLMATFVGAHVAGAVGAFVGTVAVFAGPCTLALILGPGLERWRRLPVVRSLLRGLAPAVVGLLVAAGETLGEGSIHDTLGVAVALFVFVAVYRLKVNPALALLCGALASLTSLVVRAQ